jgi:hypothetical protein
VHAKAKLESRVVFIAKDIRRRGGNAAGCGRAKGFRGDSLERTRIWTGE